MNTDSILLITSRNLDNINFGTGFVIYHNHQECYILTCAHVVKDVGGAENISISGQTARLIASGEDKNIDVSILSITGMFINKPALQLCISGTKGDNFSTAGFQFFDQSFLLRPLHGNLGEEIGLEFRDHARRISAWDLKITDMDFDLQRGYSGSPVITKGDDCVFGIVSYKLGANKGLAISIKAVQEIWINMPSGLFQNSKINTSIASPVKSPFTELKRKALEETLADMCQKYQAAYVQQRGTLSSVDKITLQNQKNQLEKDIREVETSLTQLYNHA